MKNIPESQPHVPPKNNTKTAHPLIQPESALSGADDIPVETETKKKYQQQKTKRQREKEKQKDTKKSRKSSSAKKQKKYKDIRDDSSYDDFEDPPQRSKSEHKSSSAPRTLQNHTKNERKNIKNKNETKMKALLVVVVVIPIQKITKPQSLKASRGVAKPIHTNRGNGRVTTNG